METEPEREEKGSEGARERDRDVHNQLILSG